MTQRRVGRLTERIMASELWGIGVAVRQVDRATRLLEATSELGTAETRLLWLHAAEGPLTMRDIAERLSLEQSTVNRQVNGAVKAGLLERIRQHGRAAGLVQASDEGLERLARDLDSTFEVVGEALRAVPEPARAAFIEHLTAFAGAFGDAAERHRLEGRDPGPDQRPPAE